jgi:hypothetical protein
VSLSHTLVVNGTLRVNQTDASLLFFQRHHRPFTHLGGYQVTAAGLGPAAVARLRSSLTREAAAAELETLLPRHVEKAQDSTTHAPLRQR